MDLCHLISHERVWNDNQLLLLGQHPEQSTPMVPSFFTKYLQQLSMHEGIWFSAQDQYLIPMGM